MVLGSTTEERGGVMRLRPHHLIDIITDYGHGRRFAPHPYGHAVHSVAQRIVDDPDIEIEFVLRADDICSPCCHLQADGQCDDVLRQLDPPVPKQDYNDELDRQLFERLDIAPGARMRVSEFLTLLQMRTPGIELLCAHPGETKDQRLDGLQRGSVRLRNGVRTRRGGDS